MFTYSLVLIVEVSFGAFPCFHLCEKFLILLDFFEGYDEAVIDGTVEVRSVLFNALPYTCKTRVMPAWKEIGKSTHHAVEGHVAVYATEGVKVVPLVHYVVF